LPKPTFLEYAAKVVSLLAANDGKHYAFIMSGTEPLFVGTHTGAADATHETALVNVMQNNQAGYKKKSNVWALCSYAPTAMCRGMATVAGVDGMVYWNNTTLGYANIGLSQNKLIAQVPALGVECALKDKFVWSADTKAALVQPADPAQFSEPARKLRADLDGKKQPANQSRLKESAAITGALRDIPKGDPPGAGAFLAADEVYAHLVFGMVGQTWNPTAQNIDKKTLGSGETQMGNNIAGILLDDRYSIVAWALNFAGENTTFHAETLMLQYYLREKGLTKLPANFKIYTSLQPCDMCGSFILHVANNTEVVYCLRDVNLKTVLTSSKTGATERPIAIAATTDMAALLAEKFKVKKANSAVLLADPADQTYRKLMLDQKNKKAVSATNLQQASPFKSDQRGELDTTNKKRLGAEFVKSADKIMLWSTDSSDVKRQKAAQQGVEVFEALVTHGFTTAYGLQITDVLFNRIHERNKPKASVAPVVVGVAK
jgi:tRNA(Arg) A34 adenosine deaminase TadA